MAKSLKRMMCVVMAAVLALLPMSAWAMNGELTKLNDNQVEIYGLDLAGEHSAQVDLKVVDDAGAAVPGVSFRFSSDAEGNVVYQSPYNNQTGLMTIIVSNGDKPLNNVGDGQYFLGTLNVPTEDRAFVTMQGITGSDSMLRLQTVSPSDGIQTVELNPKGGTDPDPGPDDPGNTNTNTNTNVNTNTNSNTNTNINTNTNSNTNTNTNTNSNANTNTNTNTNPGGNTNQGGNNNGTGNNATNNNGGSSGTTTKKDISKDAMANGLQPIYSYNNGNTIPIDFDFIVGGSKLENGKDYIYYFEDMNGNKVSEVNAVGKYKLVVEAMKDSGYTGRFETTFAVEDNYRPGTTNIKDAQISGFTQYYTYTGSPIKFSGYTIKYGDKVLKEGVDYTIRVTDKDGNVVSNPPIAAGSYYLIFDGIGDYSGSLSKPFIITDAPQGGSQNNQNVTGDPNKNNGKLSQTGDSMTTVVGICLAVAAVAALILAIVAFRRNKSKKTH